MDTGGKSPDDRSAAASPCRPRPPPGFDRDGHALESSPRAVVIHRTCRWPRTGGQRTWNRFLRRSWCNTHLPIADRRDQETSGKFGCSRMIAHRAMCKGRHTPQSKGSVGPWRPDRGAHRACWPGWRNGGPCLNRRSLCGAGSWMPMLARLARGHVPVQPGSSIPGIVMLGTYIDPPGGPYRTDNVTRVEHFGIQRLRTSRVGGPAGVVADLLGDA